MARLAPLPEEPISEEDNPSKKSHSFRHWLAKRSQSFSNWVRNHKDSDLRILLSVLGSPLCPVPILPQQPINMTKSPAEYIVRQYRATTGCEKMEGAVKSMYVSGKVRMAVVAEHERRPAGDHHEGRFVLWQMEPRMWLLELSVAGRQIITGSDGRVAWRHTPWLAAHAAAGGARPLRRALQGLDPVTVAAVFSHAQFVGEKHIGEEECYVLKLDVDPLALSARADGTAEMIKHVMFGYFSHRSGLLVHLEDTQLEHLHPPGAQPMYCKTTIASCIDNYKDVDGVKIAHSGRSIVSIDNFGSQLKTHQVSMQMEETWMIDDVGFNVAGLSTDSFMPPSKVERICLAMPIQGL